jgi:hypothetical protein
MCISKHHRRCRSQQGSDDPANISWVSMKLHRHWHSLFQNWSPERIAEEINKIWIDPDVEFVVKRRKQ